MQLEETTHKIFIHRTPQRMHGLFQLLDYMEAFLGEPIILRSQLVLIWLMAIARIITSQEEVLIQCLFDMMPHLDQS